ncbi:hypothetical protein [Elizabethkingia meningoseptica]|uniref:Uncharacterized protein n=1 Tax=Elizabethkingia meningoseptica TaxID=238 RepID=A0A1T3FKT1_ELIME|nr:hypothetical protein [Elizabethkingia meningoseptica]AQX13496.1 hypothetical protein BBD35_14440 [Elizabethkingia meningoseptica]MBG0515142.1 hypothetical protein [Elizabethkingia meningoseptica]MDE5434358.1 hypothetical protein [Elizabethkingia meningoseptica]OOH96218.1 hypothetical protein BMF97_07670 [Elizabethkingia meningoseptica]OPB78448.1 hypothetical protein BAY31_17015 [Elizabethkingia meningoseptica]
MAKDVNNNVIINGEKIELSKYLVSLEQTLDDTDKTIPIRISSYEDLGGIIYNLIGVCASALNTIEDNNTMSDFDKEKYLGTSALGVMKVLLLVKELLPNEEFRLLSKLQGD